MELPKGNVHVCLSGGRTSAYMLRRLLDVRGHLPDDWRVVFANTGLEFPQTLDFVREIGMRWDVPITWVEYVPKPPWFKVVTPDTAAGGGKEPLGRPFEDLIKYRKWLPDARLRFCTQELKVEAAARYLKSIGWTAWTQTLGIRADESRRVRESRDKRWRNWYPLVDLGLTATEIGAFWEAADFDLQLPNLGGKCWMSNCDGCFLKSEASRAALIREFPERAAWWERMEEWVKTVRKDRDKPVLFDRSGRSSRKELREWVENQPNWIFELTGDEAILCQADGGECTG